MPAHVVFAGADGDGVVDDAVHDRVGGHVASEPPVPVLDGVLRAEHGADVVVPVLHDLEQEGAHAFVGPVQEPFVQYEQRVRAVFADCFASMFVRQVRQCFSAVWADGFPRCRHRFPVM